MMRELATVHIGTSLSFPRVFVALCAITALGNDKFARFFFYLQSAQSLDDHLLIHKR